MQIKPETHSPDGRASRPITSLEFDDSFNNTVPKAAANLTTSRGERFSPGLPPMVPLIPEIDFINDTIYKIQVKKLEDKLHSMRKFKK